MEFPMSYEISREASYLKRSVMRDLLKHAVDPTIISLAGGLPASEFLPVPQLQECMNEVIRRDGGRAFQYGPPHLPLKEWIAGYMKSRGVDCTPEQIFITNGNQQGLVVLSRLFLDTGGPAVIEETTFTGVKQVTEGRGAEVRAIPTDLTTGADMDALEAAFAQEPRPQLAVLIPDFHNPLGVSIRLAKRKRAAELAAKYRVPLVEDDPYSPLRFTGDRIPPIRAFDSSGYVFYLGSFSKMLAPSMRLGWLVMPEALSDRITVMRESIDLESSTFIQRSVSLFLERGYMEAHLERLNAENCRRCNALLEALDRHFSDIATWTQPEGGLFAWMTVPNGVDTWEILPEAIENKVVYIPGAAFNVGVNGARNTMRLNFSNVKPELFDEGVRRLAEVVKKQVPSNEQ
jgi:2-aminoadipate transaminase